MSAVRPRASRGFGRPLRRAVRGTCLEAGTGEPLDDGRVAADEALLAEQAGEVVARPLQIEPRNEEAGGAIGVDPRDPAAPELVEASRAVASRDEGGSVGDSTAPNGQRKHGAAPAVVELQARNRRKPGDRHPSRLDGINELAVGFGVVRDEERSELGRQQLTQFREPGTAFRRIDGTYDSESERAAPHSATLARASLADGEHATIEPVADESTPPWRDGTLDGFGRRGRTRMWGRGRRVAVLIAGRWARRRNRFGVELRSRLRQ